MNGVTELASRLKKMNVSEYSPMLGTIIALPELKIQLGNRVQLDADDITAVFDIYETREYNNRTEYVNLNKKIALLPCSSGKFIAIGVIV